MNSTEWKDSISGTILQVAAGTFGVVGTIGNILTISLLVWSGALKKNKLNIIITNMCIADLIVSSFVDTFTVVGSQLGQDYFIKNKQLCEFIASVCLISCISSLMSIGLLAFNRYIQICFSRTVYESIFTSKKTLVWCILCWVIGVLVDLPNFYVLFGWGKHSYDNKTQNCMWDRTASYSYTLFFPITSIIIPCLVIAYFYAKIFLVVLSSKSRVNKHAFMTSVRISKGMFITYLFFVICWVPYGLLVMIDRDDKVPQEVYMWLMQSAHANSTFSPILFYYYNSQIEKIFNNFFRKLFNLPPIELQKNKKRLSIAALNRCRS